jgi:putative SOS response-associated peptidase YedK
MPLHPGESQLHARALVLLCLGQEQFLHQHDRIPVMLMSQDYDRWLDRTTGVEDLKAMLNPYDAALMEAYAVSRAVNSVKNDTEECIEPVEN